MSNKVYLGIDTSNYTTSIALCNENGEVIANIKKLLDVKQGERGLRQSDAVFSHVKNLPQLATAISEAIGDSDVEAIGVSITPRDVDGSYMPCFLVGQAVASMLGATHHVPVYQFSHQSGHIMAALHSSGYAEQLLKNDFVAFHVSGGTTEALLVKPNEYAFDIEIIAETADISAGQAIDRAGVMMGLQFPCGREIEALAKKFTGTLPKTKISVTDGRCNLSGLENIVQKLYKETDDKVLVSAYVLNFIGQTLMKITDQIRDKYPNIPILYAGGVMSNKYLQDTLSAYNDTHFATPELSSDNAVGIALLANRNHK